MYQEVFIPHAQLVTTIDNFYSDPAWVRERALAHSFVGPQTSQGRFNRGPIANRAECDEDMRELFIAQLSHKLPKPIQNIRVEFRYTTGASCSKNVCHADGVDYAGILYLTLPEFCQGGTSFYQHISTGEFVAQAAQRGCYDWANPDDWSLVYQARMQFNRVVFYPGDLFHSVTKPFFGNTMDNARLTQNFFITLVP